MSTNRSKLKKPITISILTNFIFDHLIYIETFLRTNNILELQKKN